jgi:FixJ family two-component response regulator
MEAIGQQSPRTLVGLMTGWDEQDITTRMKASAVDFVMFKPFGFGEMLRTVERVFEARP